MTEKIWFVKNMPHEGAGLFSSFAEKEGIPYSIVDLHRGDRFPEAEWGQAVVVLGGPDSANDTTPKILAELAALRKCMNDGVPCLGVCLGLQLLVKAAGGTVFQNSVKEIGFRDPAGAWFEMEKTLEGKKDPLLAGISDPCKVFQLHGETVGLTSSMVCLAKGRTCENQIVRIQERVYGIQGHVELSEPMFEDWLAADGDLLKMDTVELRVDFEAARRELEQSSHVFFRNFLRLAGFPVSNRIP
ncbi:MAG: type 1 glutamine amidotransferase [Candidatus Omnitrophota bacterium]